MHLFTLPAFATNYTVKAGGGGNYTTIGACIGVAKAGDTCTVYAGTYNESPHPTTSGTGSNGVCSACITFTVNPGDTVQTLPWTISASYVIVQGFTITDPTFSSSNGSNCVNIAGGLSGVQVLNNTLTQCGAAAPGQVSSGNPCINSGSVHYLTITGNTISWCSSLSSQMNVSGGNPHIAYAMTLQGDHILVQNNDISHASGGIEVEGPSYWAIIGNYFHDFYVGSIMTYSGGPTPPEYDALGCIETGNNCTTDIDIMAGFNAGTTNILMEGNKTSNIWGTNGAHQTWFSFSTTGSTLWITRFSEIYRMGMSDIANAFDTASPYGATYWKDYNDSYIQSQQQEINPPWSGCNQNGAYGSYLNNLFYNDVSPPGTTGENYYIWSGGCLPANTGYNLAYDTSCSPATLSNCTSGQMASDTGNIYADPKLVATDGSNFSLQAGSPALNAGTYLTTVAPGDSGSGTSLIVNDASYFQAGWGIQGISSDCVSVTTTTNHVCATAINYSTNTITLASGITRSVGDHVWLYSDAAGTVVLPSGGPNIGAGFSSTPQSPPASPTGLTATVD